MLIAAGATRKALELGVSQPARLALRGASRRLQTRRAHDRASSWLTALDGPRAAIRVAVISPEPTPYRSPLFDRVAARPEVDLTVIYAAETVANRTWSVEPEHRAEFLRGRRLCRRCTACCATTIRLRRRIGRASARSNPDVVVSPAGARSRRRRRSRGRARTGFRTSCWWRATTSARARGWRRAVKGFVVPRIVRRAANVLVVGTAARESVVDRGAQPSGGADLREHRRRGRVG